jgi:ketosteroid isomerase-like protein
MDKPLPVDKFIAIYQKLNSTNLDLLSEIYSPDIAFTDPMHSINGLVALRHYFANLYSNVKHCQFEISDSYTCGDSAFIYWTMHYAHAKLASGNTISVAGHSKLLFADDKIVEHRDYFDVGALLYQHIPLLGTVIKFINKRAS